MQPYHYSMGPTLEPSVMRRLTNINPRFSVTYSPFALDSLSGQPIVQLDNGRPVYDPAFYLWLDTDQGKSLINIYWISRGGLGHREVQGIEASAAAFDRKGTAFNALLAKEARQREAQLNEFRYVQSQKLKYNKRRIRELAEGRSGEREAKPISYPGQRNKNTIGTRILPDAQQDGWELPESHEE